MGPTGGTKTKSLLFGGLMVTSWACSGPSAGGTPAMSTAASTPTSPAGSAAKEDLLRWIEPLSARSLIPRERAAQQLARSRAAWTELVVRQAGEYAYLRSFSPRSEEMQNTVIKVRDNQVVERTCDRWGPMGRIQHLTETAELGRDPSCHAAETVERLYARCAALIDRAPGAVLLELHENGILAACALPAAQCGPTSQDCVTLRWVWEPEHQRPCLGGQGVHPHGSTHPSGCNECLCLNGMESCTDGGQDRCR